MGRPERLLLPMCQSEAWGPGQGGREAREECEAGGPGVCSSLPSPAGETGSGNWGLVCSSSGNPGRGGSGRGGNPTFLLVLPSAPAPSGAQLGFLAYSQGKLKPVTARRGVLGQHPGHPGLKKPCPGGGKEQEGRAGAGRCGHSF